MKLNESYKMSNDVKLMLSNMSKQDRKVWQNSMIQADLDGQHATKMVMNYDVNNGEE